MRTEKNAEPQVEPVRRGRPVSANPRRPRNITLPDEVWAMLDTVQAPGESRSAAIERLIREASRG